MEAGLGVLGAGLGVLEAGLGVLEAGLSVLEASWGVLGIPWRVPESLFPSKGLKPQKYCFFSRVSMILWSGTAVLWAGPAILQPGTAVLWVQTAVLWTGQQFWRQLESMLGAFRRSQALPETRRSTQELENSSFS